jgi:enoyl-CoA hydratase/carnithine racemase
MTEHVSVSVAGKISEICLARPDKRNAITDAMYAALADALEAANADSQVAAAIIYANGAVFTAGNDLKDFIAIATSGQDMSALSVGRFLTALTHFSKPLIAAVQGPAVGIGTTMLLHFDLIFAEPDARFSTAFVDLGLTPEGASSRLLPERIGHVRAYAMLAMGQVMSAEAALSSGLISEIVPAGEAILRARAAAENLVKRPPNALAITKQLMRGDQEVIRGLLAQEGELFYAQTKSAEAQAAFISFFQGR